MITLQDKLDKIRIYSFRWHLTVDMSPLEVHNIGLAEISRISELMEKVRAEVNFEGTLKEFIQHMRDDRQFYTRNKTELLNEYENIVYNHIAPKLSLYFGKFPKAKLEVKEMPFNGPSGTYSSPGIFFVNLNSPELRPKFMMVVLSLHEASPGHHFQLSRVTEEDLPDFRRRLVNRHMHGIPAVFPFYTSYVEGWALYAEYLGEEMGVYRDSYDLFGRYVDEIWRAVRLVVDTGIHAFGWTRKQAIDYMMKYSCDPREQIEIELDRYIIWPGQACAYKIGEIKIRELRRKAEETLGEKFDIKQFHEVVLQSGALPLRLLEEILTEWIGKVSHIDL